MGESIAVVDGEATVENGFAFNTEFGQIGSNTTEQPPHHCRRRAEQRHDHRIYINAEVAPRGW